MHRLVLVLDHYALKVKMLFQGSSAFSLASILALAAGQAAPAGHEYIAPGPNDGNYVLCTLDAEADRFPLQYDLLALVSTLQQIMVSLWSHFIHSTQEGH